MGRRVVAVLLLCLAVLGCEDPRSATERGVWRFSHADRPAARCVAERESSGNERAVNPTGRYHGLFQIGKQWRDEFEAVTTYCPDCEAMFFEGEEGHDWETCFECGEGNVYEVPA